jgi:hypothetical protein
VEARVLPSTVQFSAPVDVPSIESGPAPGAPAAGDLYGDGRAGRAVSWRSPLSRSGVSVMWTTCFSRATTA